MRIFIQLISIPSIHLHGPTPSSPITPKSMSLLGSLSPNIPKNAHAVGWHCVGWFIEDPQSYQLWPSLSLTHGGRLDLIP